jgi:hypothetical protein
VLKALPEPPIYDDSIGLCLLHCLDPRTAIVVLTASIGVVMKSAMSYRRQMHQMRNSGKVMSYAETNQSTLTRMAQALRLEGILVISILLLVLVLLLGG